ncbi:MAG: hypothetical protein FJ299_07740 [Planctomycetes bacterium]|nr:hypothetical protein [Planctomycetota bacterium]
MELGGKRAALLDQEGRGIRRGHRGCGVGHDHRRVLLGLLSHGGLDGGTLVRTDRIRIGADGHLLGFPSPEQAAEFALWLLGPARAPLSGRLVATDDPWWRAAMRAELERIQADPHAYTLRRRADR